ncbi:hypothetical protein ASPBRDRAFT_120964, partial [Aspergillus brasiliensis CBS 101740]
PGWGNPTGIGRPLQHDGMQQWLDHETAVGLPNPTSVADKSCDLSAIPRYGGLR